MTETIAIIGAAGRLGSALAQRIGMTGRRLVLYDLRTERLREFLRTLLGEHPEICAEAADTARDAGWEADIVIPAVPYDMQMDVACAMRDVVTRKIVVSVANPFAEPLDAVVSPTSAAEELARVLPHSRIVKAFNTVSATHILQPDANGNRFDCFVAGNDDDAVATVCRLVHDVGLNPVVVGGLATSRILEGMTLLLMRVAQRCRWSDRVGWKILVPHAHTAQERQFQNVQS